MLCRVLPRTLDLWGVRSAAALTLGTGRRKEATPSLCTTGLPKPVDLRCFTSGHSLGCRDSEGYASDPQVKEWMKELHKDFTQPQKDVGSEGKEGREEEEDRVSDVTKEGKEEEPVSGIPKERKDTERNSQTVWTQLVAERYQKLDGVSRVIYDYDEEKQRREAGLVEEEVKQEKVKLERGETGVFDLEELVDLLREDNAQDMVVIQIPEEMKYASYMVIVSSVSQRHRTALAELVRGAYKLKKHNKDHSVHMEGKGTTWVAMDLGNIVLHIMEPQTRETYDLETLWTVGAAFDERCQVTEEELVGVRRPRDPLAPPAPPPSPLIDAQAEAVT